MNSYCHYLERTVGKGLARCLRIAEIFVEKENVAPRIGVRAIVPSIMVCINYM